MRREQLPPTQFRRHQCRLWGKLPSCAMPLHRALMALTSAIVRWGPDASSDVLRQRVRCSKCGSKGATPQIPSWVELEIGLAPFSVR